MPEVRRDPFYLGRAFGVPRRERPLDDVMGDGPSLRVVTKNRRTKGKRDLRAKVQTPRDKRIAAASPVERSVYDTFGLEPGIPRSGILPVARDPDTGDIRLTAPQAVYDLARAVASPGVVMSGQDVNLPEEAQNFALNFTGAGLGRSLAARPMEGAVLGMSGARGKAAARTLEEEGASLAAKRPEVLEGASSPFMVSTRRPTAPNYATYGNPDERLLVQTGEALREATPAFHKNMQMLAEEPFMSGVSTSDPEAIYQEALKRGADNLSFIVNDLMDPARAAATKEWYPAAQMISERAAQRAGLPAQAGYGVTAVTSPQTPWDINVARLDRLMDMYGDRFATDPAEARKYVERRLESRSPGAIAMRGPDYAERIAAMPYEELNDKFDKFARVSLADATRNDPLVRKIGLSGEYGEPYGNITWGSGDVIDKSLRIMGNPSMENINAQLLGGGKVPSFYNNIAAPFSEAPIVTIDTHSAGAASLFPGGGNDPIVYRAMGLGPSGKGAPPAAADVARTGSKGLYGPLSDMHVIAGKQLGMLPREVQSATWEGVRDLWGQSGKTPALKQAISDIWRNSSSPEDARFQIAELLGRPVRRMFQVKP